jgi:hypothetical protein
MCRKARRRYSFFRGLAGNGHTAPFEAVGAATDFSDLRFEQLRVSANGRLARVRVTGSVRLLDGRSIDFARLNAQRGQSNVALVVFEDGAWRHCDYVPL